tara:strand:- start:533 stop:889 length:357 start_codon:yes stop_codon:yes gene_type:complete
MSAIIEAAKLQFKDRMGGKLNSSEVPEWEVGGKPTIIYYKPSMNFLDQGVVLKLHSEGKQAEAVAMTFILRSMDEDGVKLFKRAHMTEVMKYVDPEIISRVVSEMGGDDLDIEDAARE